MRRWLVVVLLFGAVVFAGSAESQARGRWFHRVRVAPHAGAAHSQVPLGPHLNPKIEWRRW